MKNWFQIGFLNTYPFVIGQSNR